MAELRTRILPPEEWPRLEGTEAGLVWPILNPAHARIVVVEDGDQVVGTWIAMQIMHAECVWVAEEHRGGSAVQRRLLIEMYRQMRGVGSPTFFTSAETPEIAALIEKLGGQPIPGQMYVVPVPPGD